MAVWELLKKMTNHDFEIDLFRVDNNNRYYRLGRFHNQDEMMSYLTMRVQTFHILMNHGGYNFTIEIIAEAA